MVPIGHEGKTIIIGDCSGAYSTFHMAKWENIVTDLELLLPDFFNIRQPQAGVQTKTEKKYVTGKQAGENKHCII